MAGLTTESKSNIAFKKLVGKAHTGNAIPFFSESIASQVWIGSSEIIGQSIATDPSVAVSDGRVEYVECDLEEIAASNGFAYNIRFPSGYSGDFGAGVAGDLVREHTQIIDQKNNLSAGPAKSDHSGGYVYDLQDNGTSVPSGSAENWQVDPVAGLVVSETELNLGSTGTIKLYIYTGDFLSEVLTDISSGGGFTGTTDDIAEGSNNLYYTDERAQDAVANMLSSGNGIQANYDDANDTYTLDLDFTEFTTDDIVEGSTNLFFTNQRAIDAVTGGITTDDLSEGSQNLFFTDERVDDRVASLVTGGTGVTVTYDDNAGTLTIDTAANTDQISEGSTNLFFTDERAQDAVAAALTAGSGVTINYDDPANTITISADIGNLDDTFIRKDGDTAAGDYDFNTGLFVLNQSANEITSDGDFTTTGTITCNELIETSTRSSKTDIREMDPQSDKLRKMKPVNFRWKNSGERSFGFIAEEVEEIYPELVHYENGEVRGMNYSKLVSVLVQKVNELSETNDELQSKIDRLEQLMK